ncbi:MAG: DUF6531 domain-containing protein, partial [Burkholderiaceae bacterium]|nr:DUF6531 domain-containing protein [Burkholderiaceae bacterium]
MDGKPAARKGDLTMYGGPITDGSPNVLIGTQGGVACSVCPGGVATDNPVNPQLGAKVLLGEEDLDFALPGALPLVWQRQYSSYVNAEHGAACGLLGHGWHLLGEITLELRADVILLFDAAGRVITFEEALAPGEDQYSRSEDIWLLRGGKDEQGHRPNWARQERFAHVAPELAGDAQCILAASGSADVFWVFSPVPDASKAKTANRTAGDKAITAEAILAAPSQHWRLSAQVDRFGRSQRYAYSTGDEADGQRRARKTPSLPAGRLIAITDGVGRRYRLAHQRIHSSHDQQGPWAADDGWRLIGVALEHDPLHALPEPIVLVRYGYDGQGQLATVHDRAGELVREFEWEQHRISAHRIKGGPWHRYRYGGQEPGLKVVAHTNEEGLDYTFGYQNEDPSPDGKPRHSAVVTDSLGRVQTYRFEGAAGLNRLIEHHRADGSVMRYQYDGFGRRHASIDPLGRATHLLLDGAGNITGSVRPGDAGHPSGIRTRQDY